jgi:hypothetical protein
MRRTMTQAHFAAILAVGLVTSIGLLCRGQATNPGSEAPRPISGSTLPSTASGDPPCVIPADLDDPAFAQHTNVLLLGVAWDNQDPALMTDVGLQLAEGERILMRPHRAIRSDRVLELAANLAGDRHDKATLARLARVANVRRDKRLKELVVRMAAESEKPDTHPIAHAIEDITPSALEAHRAAIRRIRAARYAGSVEGLDKLDKYFDELPYLHKAQQDHIDKEIAKARAGISKVSTLHDLVVTLDRLAAITPCRP